ncbi:MAG: polysaccharide biosynthesis tyrosine autokinase [Oscillospiraceae bacterium]|nr:polysaccharide biosynthesis tyrosine autokinase [Oscillospiraceae bacterium]
MNENIVSSFSATKILAMAVRSLKKLWWFLLLLTMLGAACFGYMSWSSYTPRYTAYQTFTVYAKNESTAAVSQYNAAVAKQMAKTFPGILQSGILSELVKEDMGIDYIPTISAEAQDGVNLIKLAVTSGDPEFSYAVLQSVVKNYPQIAEYVVGPSEMKVVDESGMPQTPDNARSWRGGVKKGAVLGFALGAVVLLIYGYTKATVMDKSDLSRVTNIRYLGALPPVKQKRRSSGKTGADMTKISDSGYRESLRRLTVRIDRHLRDNGRKTVMICSAASGEGKTTVALNLANALSDIHRRVLIIDCDLQKPSMYQLLNSEECMGLTDVILRGQDLMSNIHSIAEGKPDILFAGQLAPDMYELMADGGMERVMNRLRELYDYIVVDTPPCSLLSDAEELAALMDTAVMVIKQNYASRASVVEALKRLSECGLIMEGYVFNAFTGSSTGGYGYGYGYGKKYGYGYGYGKKYGYGESGDEE